MHHTRCAWVSQDPIYQDYHDNVWGRPVQNKYELFAKLCLDGQQAGLSWITILKKQDNYYQAFHQFDPLRISQMTEQDVERLMQNKGIVRNRLKINSIIKNAKGFLEIEREGLTFRISFGRLSTLNRFLTRGPIKTKCQRHQANLMRWRRR